MDYVNQQEIIVEDQQTYYGGGAGGPPSVPRPWRAQWAEQESTWIYINDETGEQSWDVPGAGYSSFGGGGGYQQEETFQEDTTTYQQDTYQQDTYQRDTYQQESFQQNTYEQETFQQDTYQQQTDYGIAGEAAAWTGEKVGEVEYDADRVKNGIENIPEDIAGWVGEKVGGVERFGAEVDGAYDVGKAEGRDGW